jgi:catechol 2,3-dioxygenase-like lactoylglutathione lyase family enzyme
MNISNIDHIVLTVKDIDKTVTFYTSVLAMRVETFAEGRIALKFGNQKINLHKHGHELAPMAKQPIPGSADVCFITDTPLQQAMEHVEKCGVAIIEGPVQRTGAIGPMSSFYFRDPDNNLIEVGSYAKRP